MAKTDTVSQEVMVVPDAPRDRLASPWLIGAFALALLLVLGWKLIADPTLSAPTRDPAWYTWRANVILQSDPGSIAHEWGPSSLFSGGYRVAVPLAGALLQRVAGIDPYSFSAFLMVGIPVLTGLVLGAGAYRSRRDGLVVFLTMLASAALFLTTPYVGYLDNITVLFLLSSLVAFASAARGSWGARVAIFLIATTAAFTHPTTCVLFGASLMGVFGFHMLTSRFRMGQVFRRDAPLLWSAGLGMLFGLASWVIGVWGPTASFSDAALPPPYTKSFFKNRLWDWIGSLRPPITFGLIGLAIVATILRSHRTKTPADHYELVSAWWLFPLAGIFTFLSSVKKPLPYYRFMNSTAAPIALAGLGAFIAIRWLLRRHGTWRVAGALASVLVVGSLGYLLNDGLENRWVSDAAQWADQEVRVSLAAVHEVVAAAGERPNILIMNYNDTADETGTNTAYGWAKTDTNIFRTGLPGAAAKYSATYLGTVENFMLHTPTSGASEGYNDAALSHWNELRLRRSTYPEPPVVFVIGQFYKGLCNGVEGECTTDMQARRLHDAVAGGTEIGPDVYVLSGDGLYDPPADVVARAEGAAAAQEASFDDHPSAFGNPLHTLRVLLGLFFLVVLPGLLAAPFLELRDGPSRIALIPAMSIVMTLLSGIAVLAVWRGSLTTAKGWAAVALACGLGFGLRLGGEKISGLFDRFGGWYARSLGSFFAKMFAVFANRDFAKLMGVQYLAQFSDGVALGAIAKSVAFGDTRGFDITTATSPQYILRFVLLVFLPYTFISPFVGVVIDRFDRRRTLVWSNLARGVLVLALGIVGFTLAGNNALIVVYIVALACTRILLAIKGAGLPGVLRGRDLLSGNAMSQAGGALLQVIGAGVATVATGLVNASYVAAIGGVGYLLAALIARDMSPLERERPVTTFGHEARRVLKSIWAGLREVAGRAPAGIALLAFQLLRMAVYGMVGLVFALLARDLIGSGSGSDKLAVAIAGLTGVCGAGIGVVAAQRMKTHVAPIRVLLGAMVLTGAGLVAFGGLTTLFGFSALTFVGGLGFFLGKISADTIVQQTMPDGFRGRAFSLFDIAYNVAWIVPAFVLYLVWETSRARAILIVSGLVFLGCTGLLSLWARAHREEFSPEDETSEALEPVSDA